MRSGKKLLTVAVAVAATVAVLTGCSHSANGPASGILTVAQVQQAVEADQQGFFHDHMDKPVLILGYVIDVEVTRIYLGATGTEQPDDGSFNIQVDVPSGEAASVNIGDQVTVRGLVVPMSGISVWIPQGIVVSVQPGAGVDTSPGDEPATSATPSSTPDVGVAPDYVGSQTITSRSGYEIEVSWRIVNPTVSVDTLHAKPGQADLSYNDDGTFELTVKNLMTDRIVSSNVWASGGYALLSESAYTLIHGHDSNSCDFCRMKWILYFYIVDGSPTQQIAPGQSLTMVAKSQGGRAIASVDESQVDQAVTLVSAVGYRLDLNGEASPGGVPAIEIPIE